MSEIAPLALRHVAALLDASQKALVAELAALGPLAAARPVSGEWSAIEVLGHLVEAERRGFAGRIRMLVAEHRPTFEPWDPEAVAAERGDAHREPEELISEFIDVREESLALVRSLSSGALGRTGVHPQVGDISISDILHEWVHHDREHLGQVLALTSAIVWPSMGSTRRFSDPEA